MERRRIHTNRYTTQMRTNTQHNQPFRLLDSIGIFLWVSQSREIDVVCFINFFLCAMSDEDGLGLVGSKGREEGDCSEKGYFSAPSEN